MSRLIFQLYSLLIVTSVSGSTLFQYIENKYSIDTASEFTGYFTIKTIDSNYLMFLNKDYSLSNSNDSVFICKINVSNNIIKTVKLPGRNQFDNCYLVTKDNNVITFYNSSNNTYNLIKVDFNGNVLWNKNYTIQDLNSFSGGLIEADNKEIIFTSTVEDTIAHDYSIFTMKFTENGDSIWQNKYRKNRSLRSTSIIQKDSTFIICGSISENSGKLFLLCINKHGDTMWSKTILGKDSCSRKFYSLKKTYDNNYVVLGMSRYSNTSFSFDLVAKLDYKFDTIWTKEILVNDQDWPTGIFPLISNKFLLAGCSYNPDKSFWDIYVIELDSIGNEIWSKRFGDNKQTYCYSISQATQNEFLITGVTPSDNLNQNGVPYLIKILPNIGNNTTRRNEINIYGKSNRPHYLLVNSNYYSLRNIGYSTDLSGKKIVLKNRNKTQLNRMLVIKCDN